MFGEQSDPSYGFTDEILKELKAEKEEVERIRRERLRVHDLKD